jgi:hypothetical protein
LNRVPSPQPRNHRKRISQCAHAQQIAGGPGGPPDHGGGGDPDKNPPPRHNIDRNRVHPGVQDNQNVGPAANGDNGNANPFPRHHLKKIEVPKFKGFDDP